MKPSIRAPSRGKPEGATIPSNAVITGPAANIGRGEDKLGKPI
jgi:hypothetical protein